MGFGGPESPGLNQLFPFRRLFGKELTGDIGEALGVAINEGFGSFVESPEFEGRLDLFNPALLSGAISSAQGAQDLLDLTLSGAFLPGGSAANPFLVPALSGLTRISREAGDVARDRFLGEAGRIVGDLGGAGAVVPELARLENTLQTREVDLLSNLLLGVFESERGRQQQALGLAPAIAPLGLNISQLPVALAQTLFNDRVNRELSTLGLALGSVFNNPGLSLAQGGPTAADLGLLLAGSGQFGQFLGGLGIPQGLSSLVSAFPFFGGAAAPASGLGVLGATGLAPGAAAGIGSTAAATGAGATAAGAGGGFMAALTAALASI